MPSLGPEEYLRLKSFLRAWDERFLRAGLPALPEADRPIAVLERTERASMAKARAGLLMAVNDVVEMSLRWSPEEVAETDCAFRESGVPTLSEVRARYSRHLSRLLRRGSIRTDVEYYLAKGLFNGASDAVDETVREKLAELIAAREGAQRGGDR